MVIGMVLLVGCSEAEPTPTPEPPTPTATPIPTDTPTPIPTNTPTPAPTDTPTPLPTDTPEPTPTPGPLKPSEVFEAVSPSVAFIDTDLFTGSGVLIEGNYIITNAHVVWPLNEARIVFPDGSEFLDVPVIG